MRRAAPALVLVLLALTGCATPPPAGETAQPKSEPISEPIAQVNANAQPNDDPLALARDKARAQAHDLVAFFASVARQPVAEQRSALVQAAQVFGREGTPYARLRLGGLHALPVAGLRDDARAVTLLEPLAKAPGIDASPRDRALADLAFVLHAQVAERQRLQREEVQERQRLLREETRKQDALRERLEALKAIERSIMQREERSQPATR